MVGHEVAAAGSGGVEALVRSSSALFREDAGVRDPYTDLGWPRRPPTTARPVKVAELQSMYVHARDRGRGVGSALRFYARRGFRPRSSTLEMPL